MLSTKKGMVMHHDWEVILGGVDVSQVIGGDQKLLRLASKV